MSFDRGRDGIFAELGHASSCAPPSALGPTIEAIVGGRVRAAFTRTIAPSRTRLQHVNDAADVRRSSSRAGPVSPVGR